MCKCIFKLVFSTYIAFFSMMSIAAMLDYGAGAAKMNSSPSIEEMMKYAIQDEYLAEAEYDVTIKQFGTVRPFTNIIQAEGKHISLLRAIYTQRGLAVPENDAEKYISPPSSIHAALAAGVQAEIDNIAMYQSFLSHPLLANAENADLKNLFTILMNASKNHLVAFRNNLKKYE